MILTSGSFTGYFLSRLTILKRRDDLLNLSSIHSRYAKLNMLSLTRRGKERGGDMLVLASLNGVLN